MGGGGLVSPEKGPSRQKLNLSVIFKISTWKTLGWPQICHSGCLGTGSPGSVGTSPPWVGWGVPIATQFLPCHCLRTESDTTSVPLASGLWAFESEAQSSVCHAYVCVTCPSSPNSDPRTSDSYFKNYSQGSDVRAREVGKLQGCPFEP